MGPIRQEAIDAAFTADEQGDECQCDHCRVNRASVLSEETVRDRLEKHMRAFDAETCSGREIYGRSPAIVALEAIKDGMAEAYHGARDSEIREWLEKNLTSEMRKNLPVWAGVMNYFPLALLYVALISKVGNDKHNPGEPLHWSKHKSSDHEDCVARHLLSLGEVDKDGVLHAGYAAWRMLAALNTRLEKLILDQGVNPYDRESMKAG